MLELKTNSKTQIKVRAWTWRKSIMQIGWLLRKPTNSIFDREIWLWWYLVEHVISHHTNTWNYGITENFVIPIPINSVVRGSCNCFSFTNMKPSKLPQHIENGENFKIKIIKIQTYFTIFRLVSNTARNSLALLAEKVPDPIPNWKSKIFHFRIHNI